ncbi:MAG: metallophosphoesterase [Methanoregula sp.]|jgi:hypothetical protein
MGEDRKLPAPDFCNRKGGGKANPVYGKGALGNQYNGHMYYSGSESEKKQWITLAQQMLLDLGIGVGETGADGKFGNDTEKGVREFQEGHEDWGGEKLNVDGLIGPETGDALNRAMVGVAGWYDRHQTEKSLTKTFSLLTVTSEALKTTVPFDVGDTENGKVVVVGEIPKQSHAASEFFMLYPALGLPDVVTDGAITALLLFKKDSWVLTRGTSDVESREIRRAIAEKLGYSAWDKKDSGSDVIPVNIDQISELAWLGIQYSGNDGTITDNAGDRRRDLVVARHVMDHLAKGAGLEIQKILRIRITPEDLGEGLYTFSNKTNETEYVKKALQDVTVPGGTPRDLESELRTLISPAPIRRYHPFFRSDKESLDIGHLTDVHVSTRYDLYERILNNSVPAWNNFNRSFEELMQGASGKADLVLITGDLIDYNRGHRIDLSKNDGNTYDQNRDFVNDYFFNRNWVLFYELLVKNYTKPVLTVLGNHEYLLNPYSTNARIRITLAGSGIPIVDIPIMTESNSFAADMNLTARETAFETVEDHNLSIFSGILAVATNRHNHNEDAMRDQVMDLARDQITNERTGCWYTTRESVTWYLLVINPFKDYWFTKNNLSILMLDWNEKQHVGSLLLLPRPTECISRNQGKLMNYWLAQDVRTFLFCSHAPVCDPWDDLGNFYLENAVVKRDLDDEDDYKDKRVILTSRELNFGAIEEQSRLTLLRDYICCSPPRIQIVLCGHSHTNRMFQLVQEQNAGRMKLRREEKPDTWDRESPLIIVTNSGGPTGRLNEVSEWMDIIPPGYRVLKFDESGTLKPETQVFFSNRIKIRDEVQRDSIKNDPSFISGVPAGTLNMWQRHDIWRFPPPSGSPAFSGSVRLNPDVSVIIDRVTDAATIADLNDGRAIAIKKIEQPGSISITNNDGTIVIEENHGTFDINDNDDLIIVDCNNGLIRVNQNDDTLLVHVNHSTIEVMNNGSASPGTDLIKIFDNHGTLTINPPHGNEDRIVIKRNHEGGTVTINYNNDTINIGENRGILNINSNEGGPGEVDSTINILDNKGGTINIRDNRGEVNICQDEPGTINRLTDSGEINMRSREWMTGKFQFS